MDFASGWGCSTVCMRIPRSQNARAEKLLVIFLNPNENYLISGIPDNIDEITYCTSRKGRVTAHMFVHYFSDSNITQPLSNNMIRTIWIDSYRINRESIDLVDALRLPCTLLLRFQPNCTYTEQSLHQLLLRAFKAEWRKIWDRRNNELVETGEFTSTGCIRNHGKYFFLQLLKEVVDELNSRTIENLTFDRKSLNMCGSIPGEIGAC